MLAPAGVIPRRWNVTDSADIYGVRSWARCLLLRQRGGQSLRDPSRPRAGARGHEDAAVVDRRMKELVDEVRRRGASACRCSTFASPTSCSTGSSRLNEAFIRANTEYGYKGNYRGRLSDQGQPSDRYVVEQITKAGKPYHYGLEAGSKPELLAVLRDARGRRSAFVICNGYKDEEYGVEIRRCSRRSSGGRSSWWSRSFPGSAAHLPRWRRRPASRRTSVCAPSCRRVARVAGKRRAAAIAASSASRPPEMIQAVEYLKQHDLLTSFELLHFHLGSQISAIRSVKNAMREAGRFYVELSKLGAPLKITSMSAAVSKHVDYDGSQTNFSSSMNCTRCLGVLRQRHRLFDDGAVRRSEAAAPHARLRESGRAVVAHHAVLILDILGVSEFDVGR